MTTEQHPKHDITIAIVNKFLRSNLSIILILLSLAIGGVALFITPREEEPQIIVPLADVFVQFPGRSAAEVERLVSTPLEKLLFQIDGVEHVYSMSKPGVAIVTVRFYVGEDRERSLVKLYNKINQNLDIVPEGVTGWVVKPIEIDDVPIVSLTLTELWHQHPIGAATGETAATPLPMPPPSDYDLRRVAEEMADRLARIDSISRVQVIGGRPRQLRVKLSPEGMAGRNTSPDEIERAIRGANITVQAGSFARADAEQQVDAGQGLIAPDEIGNIVVGVTAGQPVFLKDVATVVDGPAEPTEYVHYGRGPAWFNPKIAHSEAHADTLVRESLPAPAPGGNPFPRDAAGKESRERTLEKGFSNERADSAMAGQTGPPLGRTAPAVTIAIAKKKGTNAVLVARAVMEESQRLQREMLPSNVQMVVTRNYGHTANEKVNDLVEALAVAIVIVVILLAFGLGWRQALIVALAVPIVFGLTLAVNLLAGYTINRVTLFALILALGLLVDDPIVDVENIHRHFRLRGRATREIVLEAVNEVRPPLITATFAVIVSFLPMMFITGMMGPYMRPMALNVPVTMLMSMVVSFTITPWLSYYVLKGEYRHPDAQHASHTESDDLDALKKSFLYRFFYPLMAPLLHSRVIAWSFLGIMGLATVGAGLLAMTRHVPLKMLPFDNKNEVLLVLDFDEGTTLERTDAGVRQFESFLATVPEVLDFQSYVGTASPIDFNGLVRHYYLRHAPELAEIRVNLAGKKSREQQSHAMTLRLRPELAKMARDLGVTLKVVEVPPGPPVIATVTAEVFGSPSDSYANVMNAARTVRARLGREPGLKDLDDTIEAVEPKYVFDIDKVKASLNDVSDEDITSTIATALAGKSAGTLRIPRERQPLQIVLRLPEAERSSLPDLSRIQVKGRNGALVALGELGSWQEQRVAQTIYHKDLRPLVYVFAEAVGRAPADTIVDIQADKVAGPSEVNSAEHIGAGWVSSQPGRPVEGRTFLRPGGGIKWAVPASNEVRFSGEGEWQITLDVFRDLGLAFAAALVGIYILLVNQTGSFTVPLVVMLAIPLTVVGIMPGFWLLNVLTARDVGGFANPVFFTATSMIGMIALAGIVTRDSIILVDFIHLSLAKGRSLFDAIMESRVVRLRPILLTSATAMLASIPITMDPVFNGLAWSLIFGLLASTIFTLFVIPVTYWLLYANKPGHGLPPEMMPEPAPEDRDSRAKHVASTN